MLHSKLAAAIKSGRTFATVADLRKYLNRVAPHVVKAGQKPGVVKMHKGRIIKLAETKGLYLTPAATPEVTIAPAI